MQRLWKQQLKWDERVPTDIKLEWEQLANDVQFVKDIKIPRFLLVDSDNLFHLFGFSDASEKAYAAAIYCLSVSDTGKINVQLIIAKTRVAPLKTVSLPRLELCGALLLVKLMDFTCKALNYPISQAQFYTDSTIVLFLDRIPCQPMEDVRSQQSGENPDVVFCYSVASYQWKCRSCNPWCIIFNFTHFNMVVWSQIFTRNISFSDRLFCSYIE
ncbi:uncharacterized protein TNCT_541321 [Trichonephila clavata]|uniref:Uncharacterized protein n=1 Tax=Trichonephila clavata TaxID=2740835 RepID=A0A8X6JR31_TRICU|nr:uncharacterized protein TNCT_541321 [Trichonephila clavata]